MRFQYKEYTSFIAEPGIFYESAIYASYAYIQHNNTARLNDENLFNLLHFASAFAQIYLCS